MSLSFVLSSAHELETTHWLSVHKVTSLFMHCQNTKSWWRKRMTEQWQPSLHRFLSHMRYSTRMSGIVLTCVYCAYACVCVCAGWQSCKWGNGGEFVLLANVYAVFVQRVWMVSVMNFKRSAKQCVNGFHFLFLLGGGVGHILEIVREVNRMFPQSHVSLSLFLLIILLF